MRPGLLLPTMLFVVAGGAASAANLVSNGAFDGTDQSAVIPGWTVASPSADSVLLLNSQDYRTNAGGINDTGTGEFVGYGAGNSLDGGSVSQSFATTPGQTYTLSFEYGSFSLGPALTQSLQVTILGAGLDFSATYTTPGSTNDLSEVLSLYSATFTASAASETLTFTDTSANTFGVDGLLDNVAVSAVPEPASVALVGLGLLGFAAVRRR